MNYVGGAQAGRISRGTTRKGSWKIIHSTDWLSVCSCSGSSLLDWIEACILTHRWGGGGDARTHTSFIDTSTSIGIFVKCGGILCSRSIRWIYVFVDNTYVIRCIAIPPVHIVHNRVRYIDPMGNLAPPSPQILLSTDFILFSLKKRKQNNQLMRCCWRNERRH